MQTPPQTEYIKSTYIEDKILYITHTHMSIKFSNIFKLKYSGLQKRSHPAKLAFFYNLTKHEKCYANKMQANTSLASHCHSALYFRF